MASHCFLPPQQTAISKSSFHYQNRKLSVFSTDYLILEDRPKL